MAASPWTLPMTAEDRGARGHGFGTPPSVSSDSSVEPAVPHRVEVGTGLRGALSRGRRDGSACHSDLAEGFHFLDPPLGQDDPPRTAEPVVDPGPKVPHLGENLLGGPGS